MLDKILDFIAEHMAIVKVETVTGSTDSNGYISTGLGRNNIPLWCSDLQVKDSSIGQTARPCFLEDKNLNRISVRFKIWDDTVAGKSSEVSFKVYYIHLGGVS